MPRNYGALLPIRYVLPAVIFHERQFELWNPVGTIEGESSSLMLAFHKSGMLPSWVVVKLPVQRSSPRAAVKKGYPTWQPENFTNISLSQGGTAKCSGCNISRRVRGIRGISRLENKKTLLVGFRRLLPKIIVEKFALQKLRIHASV